MAKKKRIYFRFVAPDASSVAVLGDFNNWEERPLKKNQQGLWSTWTMLVPGRYEYRYRVDGVWCNDPEAATAPNEHGSENNVIVVG